MEHLFYESLGNIGYSATDGTYSQPGWGLQNTGLFSNLQASDYWSGMECSSNPFQAWGFDFTGGAQGDFIKVWVHDAFAVHPVYVTSIGTGDISAIPIPGAVWLLGFRADWIGRDKEKV